MSIFQSEFDRIFMVQIVLLFRSHIYNTTLIF